MRKLLAITGILALNAGLLGATPEPQVRKECSYWGPGQPCTCETAIVNDNCGNDDDCNWGVCGL